MARLSSLRFSNVLVDNLFRISPLNIKQDFTVCFWMKTDATATPAGHYRNYITIADAAGKGIYISSDDGVNNLEIDVWDGTTDHISNRVVPVFGRFLHAVLRYRASTHKLTLALEGTIVCALTYNLSNLSLGALTDTIGPLMSVQSWVANYKFWQAYLTDEEIVIERRNLLAMRFTNLLADNPLSTIYYPNAGETRPILRDESGNNHTFSFFGTDYFITPSPFSEGGETAILHFGLYTRDSITDGDELILWRGGYNGAVGNFVQVPDTGIIPPEDGVVYFSQAIANVTFADPAEAYFDKTGCTPFDYGGLLFDLTKPGTSCYAMRYDGGTIYYPGGPHAPIPVAGGTDWTGNKGWSDTVYPQTDTYVDGGGNPRDPDTCGAQETNDDYLEFTTMRRWRRDMLFKRSYTQWASWWNTQYGGTPGTSITPGARAQFHHSVKCNIRFRFATVTPPVTLLIPITSGEPINDPTPTGTVIIVKATSPASSKNEVFNFQAAGTGIPPAPFSLKDGEQRIIPDVAAGSGYSIVELPNPNYKITYTVSNGSSVNNITVADGETVTVTVQNTFIGPFSGLYFISPGKKNDTLWTAISTPGDESGGKQVVRIPNPFWIH